MKLILVIAILLVSVFASKANGNKYEIFIKPGCANCNYTKENIDVKDTNFVLFSVDSADVGLKMVRRLKKMGYDGRIVMPVIIANDSILMHPVHWDNGGYKFSNLKSVVVSLNNNDVYAGKTLDKESSGDCDFKQEVLLYYAVCCNCKTADEAMKMVDKLKKEGFSNADFIFYNKWFRVFTKVYDEYPEGEEAVNELRSEYKAAYLLKEILD